MTKKIKAPGPYTAEDHEAYRRKVEAEEAAAEQERRKTAWKLNAERAWISAGGDPDDFRREADELYEDFVRKSAQERAMSADQAAREAQRRLRQQQY